MTPQLDQGKRSEEKMKEVKILKPIEPLDAERDDGNKNKKKYVVLNSLGEKLKAIVAFE